MKPLQTPQADYASKHLYSGFANDQRPTTNDERPNDGFPMSFLDHIKSLKEPEQRAAWTIAIAADIVQIVAFPFFVEGGLSPADSLLDLVVGFFMVRLLGWHWAFLPSAAAKLIPGADLFPTWTAAVWFVTRNQLSDSPVVDPIVNPERQPGDVEILPPEPAPQPRR